MITIYENGEWLSAHPTWDSALRAIRAAVSDEPFRAVFIRRMGTRVYVMMEDEPFSHMACSLLMDSVKS